LDLEPPSYTIQFQDLDPNLFFGCFGVFFLLFLSALVSAAEVAFFSLSAQDREEVFQKDAKKGQMVHALLERPKKLLATLLVTNKCIKISAVLLFFVITNRLSWFDESPFIRFFVEVVVIAFLILFFSEVLPKIYASRNSVKFATFIVLPLHFLDKLLSPISLLMLGFSDFLNSKIAKQKSNFSVDQLSQALELTSSEGTSIEEQKILEGIVSFGSTETKQVMSPRIDVFAIEIDESFDVVLPKIIEKGFSRIPVYRDNIDHIEGVLYVKDLIPYIDSNIFDWKTLLRTPYFVPENMKLDDLLKDFQGMKNHLAVVVDEYGGTSGIVTLEDVIEEIVGDISDEFDDIDVNFSQIDTKVFLFEGKVNLKDFYRIISVDEELFEANKGEAETLAGFVLEVFGNFPKKGQNIVFSNCSFLIENIDKKRIKQIKVTIE
jgi:gliding motility-associated protein GldE